MNTIRDTNRLRPLLLATSLAVGMTLAALSPLGSSRATGRELDKGDEAAAWPFASGGRPSAMHDDVTTGAASRLLAQGAGPPRSACIAEIVETVSPVHLCVRDPQSITETALVTVSARISCPERLPLHVVFSVENDCANCPDREAWSRRNKSAAADAALRLAELAPTDTKCGVTSFGCGTRVQLDMTDDFAKCADAIGRIPTYRGSCVLPPPVEENLLRAERADGQPPIEVIVRYFRDPWNGSGAVWTAAEAAITRMANQARAAGIHQSNICDSGFRLDPESGGTPCDYVAGLPDRSLYHDVRQAGKTSADLRDLAALGLGVVATNATMIESIGPQLVWLAGTGSPVPGLVPGDPQRLTFAWSGNQGIRAVTATYRVRPRALGTLPLRSSGSSLRIVDSLGRESEPIPIPMRALTVTECITPTPVAPTRRPTTQPSPTLEPASSTPVPTEEQPTLAPTAAETATAFPSATTTPLPVPAFLPIALREHCDPGTKPIDVVLVIDASSSMAEPFANGRSKLDSAVDAARGLVGLLSLPIDRVSVVTFNADALLLLSMSGSRAEIDAALDRITTAQHSRLSRAIALAQVQLTGSARWGASVPAMVVLSDGYANPEPSSLAIDVARSAKAAGIAVFTIGAGDDADEATLAEIASGPGYYHRSADGRQLRRIYEHVAVALPCPPRSFWGRR